MTIAINTRLMIRSRLDGIGWFTYETVSRMIVNHPEHNFHLLFDRPTEYSFPQKNVEMHVLGPRARHPVAMIWWMEMPVKKALQRIKADVFLSPDGYMSLRSKIPALGVIHDINFVHYPKDVPWYVRPFYKYMFPRYAKKASRIATVSEYSKQDIARQYGIETSNIDVVYNGVGKVFLPLSNEKKAALRQSKTRGKPYFVFVGSLHPRKNITRLMQAFDQAAQAMEEEHALIIVGDKYYWTPEMEKTFQNLKRKSDVHFVGRLSDGQLAGTVAAARAMVYVPYFEGFGIPILEAFAAEIPLLTSNVSSMPEIAQDAALLVDPFDVSAIADAMQTLGENEALRERLVGMGNARKNDFSWDKTAEKLWDSLSNTIR